MTIAWQNWLTKAGIWQQMQELEHQAYSLKNTAPPQDKVYHAFQFFNPEETKVVLLGQDPYHGVEQAQGLSFSVDKQQKIPPSLRNIFLELENIYGVKPAHGQLNHWAKQGVLMLNAVLTVTLGQAGSHQKLGWQNCTKAIVKALAQENNHRVFILLGKWAQAYATVIPEGSSNSVIIAPHPSPLSAYRGFFGSKIFERCNEYLRANKQKPIFWCNAEENHPRLF